MPTCAEIDRSPYTRAAPPSAGDLNRPATTHKFSQGTTIRSDGLLMRCSAQRCARPTAGSSHWDGRTRCVRCIQTSASIPSGIISGTRMVVTPDCAHRPPPVESDTRQPFEGAGVDREVRGWEHASDHAPTWIELKRSASDPLELSHHKDVGAGAQQGDAGDEGQRAGEVTTAQQQANDDRRSDAGQSADAVEHAAGQPHQPLGWSLKPATNGSMRAH